MACIETYSTLRIFSEILSPEDITEILGIQGTKTRIKNPNSKYKHEQNWNMWLWSTRSKIESTNTEDHLGLIADHFTSKKLEFNRLHENCSIDVTSYFVSSGQGGPSISSELMKKLSALELDVWWDVYFEDEDED